MQARDLVQTRFCDGEEDIVRDALHHLLRTCPEARLQVAVHRSLVEGIGGMEAQRPGGATLGVARGKHLVDHTAMVMKRRPLAGEPPGTTSGRALAWRTVGAPGDRTGRIDGEQPSQDAAPSNPREKKFQRNSEPAQEACAGVHGAANGPKRERQPADGSVMACDLLDLAASFRYSLSTEVKSMASICF